MRGRLESLCRFALAGFAAYVCFCGLNRAGAVQIVSHEAAGLAATATWVFPEPFGPHRWRGVVLTPDGSYRLFLAHSLSGRVEPREKVSTSPEDPDIRRARDTAMGRRLEEVYRAPVWTVAKAPDGAAVSVYDLRFKTLVIPRPRFIEFRFHVDPSGVVETLGWLGRRRPKT